MTTGNRSATRSPDICLHLLQLRYDIAISRGASKELRDIARRCLSGERPDHTIDGTELSCPMEIFGISPQWLKFTKPG